uniref:ACT domain-containing protein n=1 Tax=Hyaloperonospora arabidopsidis (strain Emoy2) TaxID=559515 RepID=M4BVN8_HYAAE
MTDNKFVVHKFGGTSVGNADCFAKVADIVSRLKDPRIAVVVSAIGGKPKVTDLLISLLTLAKQRCTVECDEILATIRKKHHDIVRALLPRDVGELIEKDIERDLQSVSELLRSISIMQAYNDNVVEFVSGHGEIWSAKILTAVLSEKMDVNGEQHSFRFVDARDFLTVESNNEHGPVVQYNLSIQKMHEIVKNGQEGEELTHFVVTGFICSTVEGVMTTLKRDGSDFTASICGRVLHASSVTIWTDVSGVLSADPRRVPESRILPEISYQEAMELAYFGAKVIHPKTMAPAIVEGIPIYIRNTFEPDHPGTKISHRNKVELNRSMSNGAPTARNIVSGFSTVDDLALFNIEGSGMVGVHGTSSRLFSALDRVKINVVLIAQASSEHSICFAVPMDCAEVAKDVINETFFKEIHVGHIDQAEYIAPVSIIAAVGDQMNQTPGVCARFFGALGRAKINVLAISQGSSERNISAVVRYEDSAAALRAAHSSFFLSDQTLSIGVVGLEFEENETNSIGIALLKQYHQQREFLKQRFNVDIRVRAIGTHMSAQMLLDTDGDITEEALATRKNEFVPFDWSEFLNHVCVDHLPHWLIVDVSNSFHHVQDLYPQWLQRKVHVMTSNINVSSVSTALHNAMQLTAIENELTYDPEATLAIGVPIFNTIQNFIQTGDDIQRVEYSGSRFLHAVFDAVFAGPDPAHADLETIMKDVIAQYKNEFSVRDIIDDVMGVRSAKKAIMIAREMGYDIEMTDVDIKSPWEASATVAGSQDEVGTWSYDYLLSYLLEASEPLKQQITRTAADPKQALQLRQMTYINASTGTISVQVEALSPTHSFASLKGRQGGFAFYTLRHSLHPVVVTGPIADCSITAGSLFGSTLFLARSCGARAHNCSHKPRQLDQNA